MSEQISWIFYLHGSNNIHTALPGRVTRWGNNWKLEEGTTLEEAIETHFAEEVANVVVNEKKIYT